MVLIVKTMYENINKMDYEMKDQQCIVIWWIWVIVLRQRNSQLNAKSMVIQLREIIKITEAYDAYDHRYEFVNNPKDYPMPLAKVMTVMYFQWFYALWVSNGLVDYGLSSIGLYEICLPLVMY